MHNLQPTTYPPAPTCLRAARRRELRRAGNLQPRGGFAVLYAVITASVLLLIGLAISNISFKELVLSSQIKDSQTGIFAADAGLECALFWDLKHPGFTASIFGGYPTLDTLGNGLVGYWAFNEDAGQTAGDSTIPPEDGTLKPGTSWVSVGKLDKAIGFDGDTGFVDLGAPDLINGYQAVTVSAWIKASSLVDNPGPNPDPPPTGHNNYEGAIFHKKRGQGAGYDDSIGLTVSTGGTAFYIDQGGDNTIVALPPPALLEWTHIAAVYDGTIGGRGMELYIDGEKEASARSVSGAIITNPDGMGIGGGDETEGGSNFEFEGIIDEVRLYNRALTEEEIEVLAGQGGAGAYEDPLDPGEASVLCAGENINDPSRWSIDASDPNETKVSFTADLADGRCNAVEVTKGIDGSTQIDARGYNTCDLNNPRRVERALRATY